MGLAKLIALLMVLLLLGSTFAGLIVYFIKWIQPTIRDFIVNTNKNFMGAYMLWGFNSQSYIINKWFKARYIKYKMRVVSKEDFNNDL